MTTELVADAVVSHYRVVRLIAHGGIASTYEVEDTRGQGRFAMKRLSLGAVRDWKTYELFEREARVLAGLRHPSIPRYVEHFELELPPGEHAYYLVQELAPGASLAARVAGGWRCDETEVRRIAVQLLGILRDLQSLTPPVFHRDVKPHNILRSDDGRLFLVDFGAVRDAYRTITGGSTVVGTYGYMAPEQLRGVALPATDVYGVGSTLLFLLSGVAPNDLPQRGLRPDFRGRVRCSPALATWLDRALEPEPEKRFADARAALDSMRGVPAAVKKRSRVREMVLGGAFVAIAIPSAFFVRDAIKDERRAVAVAKEKVPPSPLPPRPPSDRSSITGRTLLSITAHKRGAFSVDVSPDSRVLASGGGDGSIRLSDAKTGEALATFAGSSGRVFSLHFTSDGARLLSAAGRRVDLWNVATHTSSLGFEVDTSEIGSARPSPDDRWIATAGTADRAVRLWDLSNGRSIRAFDPIPSARVLALAFTPDGKVVAAAGEDPTIRLWNVETGAPVAICAGHPKTVDDLAFSPDGLTLYSVSDDHTMRVWRTSDCALQATLGDHGDEVWAIAASPQGDLVATGTKDGWIKVWDAGKVALKFQFEDLSHGTTRLAFLPNGTGLAASHVSGRVNVWALPTTTRAEVPAAPVVRDPPVVGSSPTPGEACARAYALIDGSNGHDFLGEAEKLARGALAKSPHFAPAYCALAGIALRRGYISGKKYEPGAVEAAKTLVYRAAEADPKLADVHVMRAWILRASGDAAGASREANLAEANGPTSAADTILALVNSDSLDTPAETVERYALRVLAEKPTRGEAWFAYSALENGYVDAGDYEAARRAYQAQIDIDPDSAWAKGNYANFLVGTGDYPHAVEAAQRTLAQMDYPLAHQTLSRAHSEGGVLLLWDYARPEDARKEFEAAIEADPKSPGGHYGLGAYWQLVAKTKNDSAALERSTSELAQGKLATSTR